MATTTLLVSKQLVGADVLHPHPTPVELPEQYGVDTADACYLLMARLADASVESAVTVASAA